MFTGKKILIAGATGLAGTSLIRHILANGNHSKIRATFHQTHPFIHDQRISYIQADLTTKDGCRQAAQGCTHAILAAAVSGGASLSQAAPNVQTTDNLVMDALLLEACHLAGVKRVIYLSSATVYQEHQGYISEGDLDLNQDPPSVYFGVSWAKRAAEKLCRFWYEKYAMEIIILRCANIYGPYAKFDPARANFIPALIRKAVERLDPFVVWGSPQVARDVVYGEDFAKAVLLMLGKEDIPFDIFNLGYGEVVTVGEVADLALKSANHTPNRIVFSEEKPKTISFRGLDCSKLKAATGWHPQFDLADGIRETTRWWMSNKEKWHR